MATNWGQGLQTGMQGAQMGGQVGGVWGAVIGGIAGFALGKGAQDKEAVMAKSYNDQVVKFAAQDLFDLRREQNQENIRTAQALSSYQANRKTQNSSVTAAMGAGDIIGSSADALKKTLDFQTNEAMAETMINWETGIENYNTQVDRMTNQRVSSLKRFKEGAPINYAGLVKDGVQLYNQYGKGQGQGMMDTFKGIWSGQGNTPKAIETYSPLWKDMSGGGKGGGGGVLATLNAGISN